MSLNKSDVVDQVAMKAGMSKKQAMDAVNAFCAVIMESLSEGNSVNLVGFGSFDVKERAGRVVRNLQTGELIKIQAAMVPTFKFGKSLKEAVKKTCVQEEEVS